MGALDGTRFVGRNGHLLARLDHRGSQWVLCVFVLVQFEFDLAESARAKGVGEWTDSEQDAWKRAFIRSAENTFSYQWSLQTSARSRDELGGALSVDVELIVEEIDPQDLLRGRQHVFTVFVTRGKTDAPETFASGDDPQIQLADRHIESRTQPTHPDIAQRLTDHEIAHALGLDHPNCKGKELRCYGDPKTETGQRIVGLGSRVSAQDYVVFAEIMKTLMPGRGWMVRRDVLGEREERPAHWMRIPGINSGRMPGPVGAGGAHNRQRRKRTR